MRKLPAFIYVFWLTAILFVASSACAGKMVGVVFSGDIPRYRDAQKNLVKALAQKGFDHNSLEIVIQAPNPDPISWANSIRKIESLGADLLVTYGAPATLAAIREDITLPIVFVDVYGPRETGILKNLAAPELKVTGVTSKVPLQTLIRTATLIKSVRTMGIIYNSREIGSAYQLKELKRIASQLGFSVEEINVASSGIVEQSLTGISRFDMLFVSESAVACKLFDRIVQKAMGNGVPVVSTMPDAAERGALVSLEINTAEQGQLAAEQIAKILSVKKFPQISVAIPKKNDLIINLKAAKHLDLTVPFQALSNATRVIK